MEGTAKWLATGVEYRGVVKHGRSIRLPSSMKGLIWINQNLYQIIHALAGIIHG